MGVESVLLYYKYVDLEGQQDHYQNWFKENCGRLGLVGRVRVAKDGINVTIGGNHQDLLEHIQDVRLCPEFGDDIDMKLARSAGAESAQAITESHFDSIHVSICKEVVSLKDALQCHPDELPQRTGQHLSPEEWHATLHEGSGGRGTRPILLDARNIYETRVGHFRVEGMELLDPQLRQFSDLPRWVKDNAERLEGRKVLMYCTGGVRCERASAMLKSMGPGFQDVCQLKGGIQRYLESFVDGGFFRGKNFVFDERVTVPPSASLEGDVVGSCLLCKSACDSYKPRVRCGACRMLVLVCPKCEEVAAQQLPKLQCELCQARRKAGSSLDAAEVSVTQASIRACKGRKLKILCLHGFRQDARLMQDSLAWFQREFADIVQLEFAEAPHTLPHLYRPNSEQGEGKELPRIDLSRPRRAWLLEPSQAALSQADKEEWTAIDGETACSQYTQQTAGWPETWEYLQGIWSTQGPFDGLLGFSQGAAVVAAFCASLQKHHSHYAKVGDVACESPCPDVLQPAQQASIREDKEGSLAREGIPRNGEDLDVPNPERGDLAREGACPGFVILVSGYLSRAALPEECTKVDVPSLHIYAHEKIVRRDRQIPWYESKYLEECFSSKGKVVVQHSKGHIMPADKASQAEYRKFLQKILL